MDIKEKGSIDVPRSHFAKMSFIPAGGLKENLVFNKTDLLYQ